MEPVLRVWLAVRVDNLRIRPIIKAGILLSSQALEAAHTGWPALLSILERCCRYPGGWAKAK